MSKVNIEIDGDEIKIKGGGKKPWKITKEAEAPARPKKPLAVTIILDRSGSMETIRDITISAVNEYVHGLKVEGTKAFVTLALFDTAVAGRRHLDYAIVYSRRPIEEVPPLTRETFVPRNGTPLNDAIGRAVSNMDNEVRADEDGVLVIVTDGQENASSEYTTATVKKLLEGRQKDKGWLVMYLGANQNAFAEAELRGIFGKNSVTFKGAKVENTLRHAARNTVAYAAAGGGFVGLSASGFTPDELKDADEA